MRPGCFDRVMVVLVASVKVIVLAFGLLAVEVVADWLLQEANSTTTSSTARGAKLLDI